MRKKPYNYLAAFTLVEMLVVITIIGILAGLTIGVVMRAIPAAQEAAIQVELSQLDTALKAYKEKHSEYPPDFTDLDLVKRHLSKRFPRWRRNQITAFVDSLPGLSTPEALVFWLSNTKLNSSGERENIFYKNPINPTIKSTSPEDIWMEFDETRLKDSDNDKYYSYVPKNGLDKPYVYFNAATYTKGWSIGYQGSRPYLSAESFKGSTNTAVDTTSDFMNPKTYQIISAGLDGEYGTTNTTDLEPKYPEGPYSGDLVDHADNLVNFSSKNLGNSIP